MKLALCQLAVTDNKSKNLNRAEELLCYAKNCGADVAVLPEMFCISYKSELFRLAAEPLLTGDASNMLSETAKKLGITIIGGSIPELSENDGKIYNTSMSFGKDGSFLGCYRKAHLFDVELGSYHFKESDTISKGDALPLIVNVDSSTKIGVMICFDIRFPEWSRILMLKGANILALPAAFSTKTGPLHWELLLRARAVDNQCFCLGVAPAASPCSFGHTMAVSPNGEVIACAGTSENVLLIDVDNVNEEVQKVRCSIPIFTARRLDLYTMDNKSITKSE